MYLLGISIFLLRTWY